jgi:hypothetical protein
MSASWKTKFGSRRVRYDPPTIAEALAAAQDLTDEAEQQIEIAAGLMDVSHDEVRAELAKLRPAEAKPSKIAVPAGQQGKVRTVIVERKTRRTIAMPPRSAAASA